MMDLNAVVNSPFAAFGLSLFVIGAFVGGQIVSGKSFDRLLASLDKLSAAVEVQNALTKQALNSSHDSGR